MKLMDRSRINSFSPTREDLTEVGQNVEMSHITSDLLVDRSAFTHAGYGATSGFWNLSVIRSLSPMAT